MLNSESVLLTVSGIALVIAILYLNKTSKEPYGKLAADLKSRKTSNKK